LSSLDSELTAEVGQAADNRSVKHFITHLNPDSTNQAGVNIDVDLQLAAVQGIQPGLQTAGLVSVNGRVTLTVAIQRC
jgi:hypothetical protein